VDENQGSTKKYCFNLKDDKVDYLFACEDAKDLEEWKAAVTANLDKPPKPPLTKEKKVFIVVFSVY
jgi:hypothetical protein